MTAPTTSTSGNPVPWDRLMLLVLAVVGIVGFVVLALFDQFAAALALLAGVPTLGVLLNGKQIADVKQSVDQASAHVAELRNGELVAKVRQGVEQALTAHYERGIVEQPFRPSAPSATVETPTPHTAQPHVEKRRRSRTVRDEE